jgi:hypothetical protein
MLSDRLFGISISCGLTILGCSPLLHGKPIRKWAIVLAGLLLLGALVRPSTLHPLAIVFARFAHIINRALTLTLMGLLFFAVITPIGLFRRVLVKDPLSLRKDASVDSYWIKREPAGPPPGDMANPY